MCKATTKSGGACPHYALKDRAYCRMHMGKIPGKGLFEKLCRTADCDHPVSGLAFGNHCRFHTILADAVYLKDQGELADLIAQLRDVKVLTVEERAQRRRDAVLASVRRSVLDLDRERKWAIEAGATPEQITEAIGPDHIFAAKPQK